MSNHPHTTWTAERKNTVAKLLLDGLSASAIGAQIGCSRNAVIGVVGRDKTLSEIGFSRRRSKSTVRVQKVQERKAASVRSSRAVGGGFAPTPAHVSLPVPAAEPIKQLVTDVVFNAEIAEPFALPLADLNRDQCRFVVNNAAKGEQHLFCGHEVGPGKHYCPDHYRRMYQPRQTSGA